MALPDGMTKFGFDPESPNYWRALRNAYRNPLRVGPPRLSADDIPIDATDALLERKGKSHIGISARKKLTALAAVSADQSFLDEIGELHDLTHLDLRFPMRAHDLSPLRNLKKLRVLRIDSCSKVTDFSPLADLPSLQNLQIENAQHLYEIDWLKPLKSQLGVLGLEGTVNKDQRIASLAPIEGFAVEAIFLVSAMVKDKSIAALFECPNLHFFDGARCAPKREFEELERRHPDMHCGWFDAARW
jgi:hypothetical protein